MALGTQSEVRDMTTVWACASLVRYVHSTKRLREYWLLYSASAVLYKDSDGALCVGGT